MTAAGFIDLGDQGAPIAGAVADGGHDLHVWARRPASLEALTGTTYTGHDSVAELAAAVDVLLLCLRDDADTADLLEHGRLLDGLRPGSVVVGEVVDGRRVLAGEAQPGLWTTSSASACDPSMR